MLEKFFVIVADTGPFDMFDADTPTILTQADSDITEGLKGVYAMETRIAIFCMVIALILAGISIIMHNSNKKDVSQNKTMLTRIIIAAACIFAAGGIIDMVISFGSSI